MRRRSFRGRPGRRRVNRMRRGRRSTRLINPRRSPRIGYRL